MNEIVSSDELFSYIQTYFWKVHGIHIYEDFKNCLIDYGVQTASEIEFEIFGRDVKIIAVVNKYGRLIREQYNTNSKYDSINIKDVIRSVKINDILK
jgi:hypothetical protein